jgi:RNA polymerase II elongation factor ELL
MAMNSNNSLLLTSQPNNQILHYGTKVQPLSTSADPLTREVYRSSTSNSDPESSSISNSDNMARLPANPKKGVTKVQQTPHPQFLAMLGAKSLTMKKPTATSPAKATPKSIAASITKTSSLTAGTDAALAQLQSSMASENAKKAGNTYDWYSRSRKYSS